MNHVPKELTNSHTAIQIVEHDAECSKAAARKGLRVQKTGDGRNSKLGVVEWVKSANARISALGQHNDGSSILLSNDEEFEDDEYTMHMTDAFDVLDDGVGNSH
ncbi:hypothetical protein V6N11_047356 [Hibiscus sabdariffa]|uniref:Uncharacterized protein n=1 Tax=Hibiscus sabdariffa TaxID=183260 RepID=A0ABR2NJZ7_9ROSI